MNSLPNEILHQICAQLEPQDVRNLRLCGRGLADVGACYGFPRIIFYLCKEHLQMLKDISEHRTIAPTVRSLLYMQDAITSPILTFEEYRRKTALPMPCSRVGSAKNNYLTEEVSARLRTAADGALLNTAYLKELKEAADGEVSEPDTEKLFGTRNPLSVDEIQDNYRQYKTAFEEQEQIVSQLEDFEVLRQVIPQFPSLKEVSTQLSEGPTDDLGTGSPFGRFFVYSLHAMQPEGAHHLNALLYALNGSGAGLSTLKAGYLDFSLIEEPLFNRIIRNCPALTSLDLVFSTGDYDVSTGEDDTKNIVAARHMTNTGVIANFLKAVPALERIAIEFTTVNMGLASYPALLSNILAPEFHWPRLRELRLHGITTEDRSDFFRVFDLHKTTLRTVELRDCQLNDSSWTLLLRQMKETLTLDKFMFDGTMFGFLEDDSVYDGDWIDHDFESWWLGYPDDRWLEGPCLADKVVDWFMNDAPYPLIKPVMLEDSVTTNEDQ